MKRRSRRRWLWLGSAAGIALAVWVPPSRRAIAYDAVARLQPAPQVPLSAAPKTFIPYADARSVIEALRQNLPVELRGKRPAELELAWPTWVAQRDEAIRARLERGDEDSIVYLWHYGTSFTGLPPVTERNIARLGGANRAADILQQRLEDLLGGIASPGGNERLQFARQVVERQGIDPLTPAGVAQARLYLERVRQRVLTEYEEHRRTLESVQRLDPVAALAASVTLFRDRGLSSDTSLLPAFAIEQALQDLASQGRLTAGSVRRVAIVGPGFDVANKDEGHDFYPPQTIQPFALIDGLVRFGLAKSDELLVATFDLSARVNRHIEAAREHARAGRGYTVHLALPGEEQWNPELVAYWQRFGERIGTEAEAPAAPPSAGVVRARAVRIPPARVGSVVPRDVNIVLERLEPLAADARFDLIVATNVLVYYDVFEQELALINIGRMLRPGGVFLSNTPVPPMPPMALSNRYTTVSYNERQRDYIFWYERE